MTRRISWLFPYVLLLLGLPVLLPVYCVVAAFGPEGIASLAVTLIVSALLGIVAWGALAMWLCG